VMFMLLSPGLRAQSDDVKAIQAVMDKQAADWNKGDLEAFAMGYKNSPDILFISAGISRGYDGMLRRYKKSYPTRESMGTLTFSKIEVQPLDERFATLTGNFHLDRTAVGGGNADGHYMLVVEKTAEGWKVVRDVTLPQAK
jgi:uncharacterized protein (TIGR02246 family)